MTTTKQDKNESPVRLADALFINESVSDAVADMLCMDDAPAAIKRAGVDAVVAAFKAELEKALGTPRWSK